MWLFFLRNLHIAEPYIPEASPGLTHVCYKCVIIICVFYLLKWYSKMFYLWHYCHYWWQVALKKEYVRVCVLFFGLCWVGRSAEDEG